MHAASLAVVDWFIPRTLTLKRTELGRARNFVVSQFIYSALLVPIVVALYGLDPTPGPSLWIISICTAACWLMPLGLKVTRNFRLMAFTSVELLCTIALIGSFEYGSITSPFVPWLVVSLMLGFFYLSDQALLVILLFAGNIAATLTAALIYPSDPHIAAGDLVGLTWFSIFSATAYMAHMAIYYSNILTMSSDLERETELHRQTAQHLREAKQNADTANAGREIFLAKMTNQLRMPLATIVADSEALLRADDGPRSAQSRSEIEKIHAAGLRLLSMVASARDVERHAPGAPPPG